MSSWQFRRALEEGDYMGMWRCMAADFPGADLPKTAQQAEIAMHRIRAETESIPFGRRAFSHAWLLERGYPSGLPDHLRPKAQQICPVIVKGVGIAVRMPKILTEDGVDLLGGLAQQVERSMADAVEELHADGVDLENRPVVHGLMFERRQRTLKKLLGTTTIARVKA